jgi:hypothetical protein
MHGSLGRELHLALRGRLDGSAERLGIVILEEVADGAGPDRGADLGV